MKDVMCKTKKKNNEACVVDGVDCTVDNKACVVDWLGL